MECGDCEIHRDRYLFAGTLAEPFEKALVIGRFETGLLTVGEVASEGLADTFWGLVALSDLSLDDLFGGRVGVCDHLNGPMDIHARGEFDDQLVVALFDCRCLHAPALGRDRRENRLLNAMHLVADPVGRLGDQPLQTRMARA